MEWIRRGILKFVLIFVFIGLIFEWVVLWLDFFEIYCSYIFSFCEFVDYNYFFFLRLLIVRSFWNNFKMILILYNLVRSVRLLYILYNIRYKIYFLIVLEICSWKLYFIILIICDLWFIFLINVCNYIYCILDELLCN